MKAFGEGHPEAASVATELEAYLGELPPPNEILLEIATGPSWTRIVIDLIAEIQARASGAPRDGRACLIAGPPGSGKTHHRVMTGVMPLGLVLDHELILERLVETDPVRIVMDRYTRRILVDGSPVRLVELSGLLMDVASQLLADVADGAMSQKMDLVIEHTWTDWASLEETCENLRRFSYGSLDLVALDATQELAMSASRRKWWSARQQIEAHPPGARFVPRRLIESSFPDASAPSYAVENMFDAFRVFGPWFDSSSLAVVNRANPEQRFTWCRPQELGRTEPFPPNLSAYMARLR